MSVKQTIGVIIIAIVLCCTILAIGGVWGFIDGDAAWQIFATMVVVAMGLGTSGILLDAYFKDKAG